MTTLNATRTPRTVTRGQVAKAVLAVAHDDRDIPWLADALGYDDERTYRTVSGINALNQSGGRG